MSEIARLRKLKKLTQQQLATLANTSQPQIRRLENGERTLTREWAERLSPHLGVTPEALIFPDKAGSIDRKLRLLAPDISELLQNQFAERIESEIALEKRRGRGDH